MKAFIALAGVALMVAPWLTRTWVVTGAPVLSSQTGSALWKGNNPKTFSHYPQESIDLSSAEAYDSLTPQDNAELARLPNEIQQSDWFARRAMGFMKAHPAAVLRGALRKIGAGFSWTLNPVRDPLAEAAYRIGWIPVSVLGAVGLVRTWPRRGAILISLMLVSFVAVTAVFWAHTSHRSYLDVFFAVFTACPLQPIPGSRRGLQ